MAGTDDRAAAGAGTTGSGYRLPAARGVAGWVAHWWRRRQRAPVAAAALKWLGVAGPAE